MADHSFLAFLLIVGVVMLAPGADFTLVLRNTVVGGRGRGWWTALGIGVASAVQGALVAFGVGAVIVRIHPLFLAIKWVGIAYLLGLGAMSLRRALRGSSHNADAEPADGRDGFRQGLLCNAANPKMLVFYLGLLPQFVSPDSSPIVWLGHALVLPLLGTFWLFGVVALVGVARELLLRRRVRRAMDAVTGVALIGFGVRVAAEG